MCSNFLTETGHLPTIQDKTNKYCPSKFENAHIFVSSIKTITDKKVKNESDLH
uniref:Uncharacterized protein n=1 Tax=Meloidogyne enterolobii TaxID=390850 RepID=A0A6V7WRF7_MELEN|nr:unnamed protein product [Meloidogyne enterolobii]